MATESIPAAAQEHRHKIEVVIRTPAGPSTGSRSTARIGSTRRPGRPWPISWQLGSWPMATTGWPELVAPV
jgi:hypothetical protein